MWRVYKHTGKDKDYEAYKEALNAATNEDTIIIIIILYNFYGA